MTKNFFRNAFVLIALAAIAAGLLLLRGQHPQREYMACLLDGGALACLLFAAWLSLPRQGWIFFNLAFLVCLLLGAEVVMKRTGLLRPSPKWLEGEIVTPGFKESDPVAGYRIKPIARSYTARSRSFKQVFYDTVYHVDAAGHRVTPTRDSGPLAWFAGDSFTFGDGLTDQHTLPWVFSEASGYRAINFGVSGYGPHNVLAQLQPLLDDPASEKPRLVVLQLLPTHVSRVAGLSPWDQDGPWMTLNAAGRPERQGSFRQKWQEPYLLRTTQLYELLSRKYVQPVKPEDYRLLVALVDELRDRVEAKGGKFVLIWWDTRFADDNPGDVDAITPLLTEQQFNLISLWSLLQARGINTEDPAYFIAGDGHPNAASYQMLSDSLRQMLVTLEAVAKP